VNLSDVVNDDTLIDNVCDWAFGLRLRDDSNLDGNVNNPHRFDRFFEKVKDGQTVCIQGDDHNFPEQQYEAMSNFFTYQFQKLEKHIKILSVQSDDPTPPARFRHHLENPYITAWYGWNLDDPPHEKLHPVPIGLKQSHMKPLQMALTHLKEKDVTWATRSDKVLFNYGSGAARSTDLRKALWNMSKDWSFAEHVDTPEKHEVSDSYLDMISKHKFIACPRGEGKDTHRVWEALYLGMVPVVLKSSLSQEYDNLPVIQLEKWEDLPERYKSMITMPAPPLVKDLDKMKMSYWINTIGSRKS